MSGSAMAGNKETIGSFFSFSRTSSDCIDYYLVAFIQHSFSIRKNCCRGFFHIFLTKLFD